MSVVKRLLLGRPIASEEAQHTLLPKFLALPIFASDALSSNAYATEEMLHVLEKAGRMALSAALPIAAAVAALLIIVITSYRQTVRAYPGGGGSYIVTRENIGQTPGLVAAAALLIDYVLTVAVSMAAGSLAIASLVPELYPHRVALAVGFITLTTFLNLRGAKESGFLFAIPTYGFVISIMTMLAIGLARCTIGTCPVAASSDHVLEASSTLGLFLVLKAFASGSTALTGVEAIADGVPAFRGRRPADQARNAATTLGMLGVLTVTMFVGITFLAHRMEVVPVQGKSVVAQIALAIFGNGIGFGIVQVMTALILILAANTAYQDFPRLSSIIAKDRFMPRQMINRGDRLVFSNGIIVLAVLATALIYIYDAEVTRLIQLYVVGVFTSFTLSQAGMVQLWRRLRNEGWRKRAAVNLVGACTTGLVLVVVAVTKFAGGAWIVIVAIPMLVLAFRAVHRHYTSVATQLRLPEGRPPRSAGTRAVVLVERMDAATLRAVGYATAMRPLEVRAVHIGQADGLSQAWTDRRMGVPLTVDPGRGDLVESVRAQIEQIRQDETEFVTVVVPEAYRRTGKREFLSRRRTLLLKASLLFERGVVVTDVATVGDRADEPDRGAITPTRVIAVVLVSAVHNATLRALEYARSLSPTDLRAVTFNVDQDETARILEDWISSVEDIPLEAVDSPYREIVKPLMEYAGRLRQGRPDAIVSIIVPEFVVRGWWHQFLHNQTALAIKYALLFEPNIVLTSVPFHLD